MQIQREYITVKCFFEVDVTGDGKNGGGRALLRIKERVRGLNA